MGRNYQIHNKLNDTLLYLLRGSLSLYYTYCALKTESLSVSYLEALAVLQKYTAL